MHNLFYWTGAVVWCAITVAVALTILLTLWWVLRAAIYAVDITAFRLKTLASVGQSRTVKIAAASFWWGFRLCVVDGPPDSIGTRDGGCWCGFHKWKLPEPPKED